MAGAVSTMGNMTSEAIEWKLPVVSWHISNENQPDIKAQTGKHTVMQETMKGTTWINRTTIKLMDFGQKILFLTDKRLQTEELSSICPKEVSRARRHLSMLHCYVHASAFSSFSQLQYFLH